jgi:hydroxysqualene synthase
VGVDHYENFPVASVLCPPAIRPAVVAIYHFARTADDLADEGQALQEERLRDLRAYRADLDAIFAGQPVSTRWAPVFRHLDTARQRYRLPHTPLADLLDAFMQDTGNPVYETREQLLDYCRRSANPIGRLLLHLYGIGDAGALSRSDDICTALQLINFWQDFSVDHPRGRVYIPAHDAAAHGLNLTRLTQEADSPESQRLIADLCDWAEGLMQRGAPLALQIPGRAGWELRLVVQGGLRILECIRQRSHRTLHHRPTLGSRDVPRLLWRAIGMRAPVPDAEPIT